MSRETEIKKKLRIRILDGYILSYSSMENIFKNVLKCNMFDSDIKIFIGRNCVPEFFLELSCNVNRQLSTDLLLDELPKFFSYYTITKRLEEKKIFLNATLRNGKKSPNVNNICEPIIDLYQNTDNWFSLFIEEKEFDLKKIESFIENIYKEAVGKIKSITIENFNVFKLKCSNNKEYTMEYSQFESFKNFDIS